MFKAFARQSSGRFYLRRRLPRHLFEEDPRPTSTYTTSPVHANATIRSPRRHLPTCVPVPTRPTDGDASTPPGPVLRRSRHPASQAFVNFDLNGVEEEEEEGPLAASHRGDHASEYESRMLDTVRWPSHGQGHAHFDLSSFILLYFQSPTSLTVGRRGAY